MESLLFEQAHFGDTECIQLVCETVCEPALLQPSQTAPAGCTVAATFHPAPCYDRKTSIIILLKTKENNHLPNSWTSALYYSSRRQTHTNVHPEKVICMCVTALCTVLILTFNGFDDGVILDY